MSPKRTLAVCKSKQPVHEMADEEEQLYQDSLFLGELKADSTGWYSDIKMNGEVVSFKLDTGAGVTAIPTKLCKCKSDGPLLHTCSTQTSMAKQEGLCRQGQIAETHTDS